MAKSLLDLARKIEAFGADPEVDYYHGSTWDIEGFDTRNAKPDGDWGPGTYKTSSVDDANENYARRYGPDNTSRIGKEAESVMQMFEDDNYTIEDFINTLTDEDIDNIAKDLGEEYLDAPTLLKIAQTDEVALDSLAEAAAEKRILGPLQGVNYPLKVNTQNYATIGPGGTTIQGDPDSLLGKLEEALYDTTAASEEEFIPDIMAAAMEDVFDSGELNLTDLDYNIRNSMREPPQNDEGEYLSHGATSAEVLRNLGYEGVRDQQVYNKFGNPKFGQGMEGVYPDTEHVITFPNNEDANIRSKFAEFAPKGQEDMSKPSLLRQMAMPAIGAGMAGYGMAPRDAMAAQGFEDVARGAGGIMEALGREVAGGVAGASQRAFGGSAEDIRGAQEDWRGNAITQRPEMMEGLKTIGAPIGRGIMDAAKWIGEKGEPIGRAVMDFDSPLIPGDATVGDRLTEFGQDASQFYGDLSEEDKAGLGAAGGALGLLDAVSGGATAPARRAAGAIDPRYFNRITEQRPAEAGEYQLPNIETEKRGLLELPKKSIVDYEGRPFVAAIADRTNAGEVIKAINGIGLDYPTDLQGGQKFMRELKNHYEGKLWASEAGPAQGILNAAKEMKKLYGVDPIFIPWRMTPTGGDFSTMSGELLMANALAVLNKKDLNRMSGEIRDLMGKRTFNRKDSNGKVIYKKDDKGNFKLDKNGDKIPEKEQREVNVGIPNFPDLGKDPEAALNMWRTSTGDQRKEVKKRVMDAMRNETGLSQPDARLAVTDPDQLREPDFMLQNVGIIDANSELVDADHNTYGKGILGTPDAELIEEVSIFDVFPGLLDEKKGNVDAARRSLETKAATGIIDENMLKTLFQE